MRITVVTNPRSGRGKAKALGDAISSLARGRGHTVDICSIDAGAPITPELIYGGDRLVIVGGDGTVHHMLGMLSETRTPFYHCGTGTANLICHAFGMSRKPQRALEQLEREVEPIRVDLPTCNGHPFLIMTSLGMDASVIHRLEESRRLGGYRAYIKPVLREILKPRFAHLDVELDGDHSPLLSRPGVLVIANMRNYGGGFNPCAKACWHDGRIDIAHISGRTSLTSGLRYLALLSRLGGARCASAEHIKLTARQHSFVQIDGERPSAVPSVLEPQQELEFRMSLESVYVHAPAAANPCDP